MRLNNGGKIDVSFESENNDVEYKIMAMNGNKKKRKIGSGAFGVARRTIFRTGEDLDHPVRSFQRNYYAEDAINFAKKGPTEKEPAQKGPTKKEPAKKGPTKKEPAKKGPAPKKGPDPIEEATEILKRDIETTSDKDVSVGNHVNKLFKGEKIRPRAKQGSKIAVTTCAKNHAPEFGEIKITADLELRDTTILISFDSEINETLGRKKGAEYFAEKVRRLKPIKLKVDKKLASKILKGSSTMAVSNILKMIAKPVAEEVFGGPRDYKKLLDTVMNDSDKKSLERACG